MKGFWIPAELVDLDISWTKRILLAEISQLEMLDKGCIASNYHFAKKLKLSKQAVSKALNELNSDEFIIINNAQTKRNFGRTITINFSKSGINFSKSGIHESGESKDNNPISKQDIYISYSERWNKFAGENGLAKIAKMTDSRKKKLYSRIKEIKEFDKLFDLVLVKISESSFLLGNNKTGWEIDFDWMINNDTNMIKIYEGKYNNG